jgi:ABC-type amino acid transport system permease subunit
VATWDGFNAFGDDVDNLPDWLNIALLYVFVALIFQFIYMLDQRTKVEGLLFTQPITIKGRIYAFLLAILLGTACVIFVASGFEEDIHTIVLALASVGLLAYSLGFDWPLRKIQTTYAEVFHGYVRTKKILGAQDKTIDEVLFMVQGGARFLIFEYSISPLLVTLDYTSNIHLVDRGEDTRSLELRYSMISVILGWWSLFGPIYTVRSIVRNLRGGQDVTKLVVDYFEWIKQQTK